MGLGPPRLQLLPALPDLALPVGQLVVLVEEPAQPPPPERQQPEPGVRRGAGRRPLLGPVRPRRHLEVLQPVDGLPQGVALPLEPALLPAQVPQLPLVGGLGRPLRPGHREPHGDLGRNGRRAVAHRLHAHADGGVVEAQRQVAEGDPGGVAAVAGEVRDPGDPGAAAVDGDRRDP